GQVELEERPVPPQAVLATGVEAQTLCNHWQHVVAGLVGKVAGGNLGQHVPAGERGGWIADTSHLEEHVGDGGEGVPLETEPGKPGVLRVGDGDLEDRIARNLEQARAAIPALNDEGQDVEGSARSPPPAEGVREVREMGLPRITQNRAIRLAVSG